MISDGILGTIGKTPVVRIQRLVPAHVRSPERAFRPLCAKYSASKPHGCASVRSPV
jgi:hypothetical protein